MLRINEEITTVGQRLGGGRGSELHLESVTYGSHHGQGSQAGEKSTPQQEP